MSKEVYDISTMTILNVEGAAEVEKASFSQPWSVKAFRDMLEGDRADYVVALLEGKVVGVCGLLYSFEEAEVSNVAVLPEYRGKGISRQMLQTLLKIGDAHGTEAFSLEVRVSNIPAIHLYNGLGFEIEATRKNCYKNPDEDGYIMWKRK